MTGLDLVNRKAGTKHDIDGDRLRHCRDGSVGSVTGLVRSAGDDEASQRLRFDADIAEVRRRGISRATNPNASPLHQVAVNAFSAPIFNGEGHKVIALSLSSSAARLEPDWDARRPPPRGG